MKERFTVVMPPIGWDIIDRHQVRGISDPPEYEGRCILSTTTKERAHEMASTLNFLHEEKGRHSPRSLVVLEQIVADTRRQLMNREPSAYRPDRSGLVEFKAQVVS